MKKSFLVLAGILLLSGCATWEAMSENEKQTAMWVGGIVLTAVVISEMDNSTTVFRETCVSHSHKHGCD